jgi:CRP/FNR family transcriptional regulator, nitrogen fixation regulation protein
MQAQQTILNRSQHLLPKEVRRNSDRSNALTEAFKSVGRLVRFERNTEIQADGEPAEYFYQIASGAARTYKLLDDGRRLISAFHLPGDVVELEASPNHRFSAEAIEPSVIRIAKRSAILDLAERNPELATEIWRRTANNLQSAQELMMLLGRKNAEERVASFLLEMADRSPSEPAVDLPMTRQDIADYLGLTIETVSRSLGQLESASTINRSTKRQIRLCNRPALQRLND